MTGSGWREGGCLARRCENYNSVKLSSATAGRASALRLTATGSSARNPNGEMQYSSTNGCMSPPPPVSAAPPGLLRMDVRRTGRERRSEAISASEVERQP
eukprot:scaffold21476_cov77-Isochrysis_galbana.AAC.3